MPGTLMQLAEEGNVSLQEVIMQGPKDSVYVVCNSLSLIRPYDLTSIAQRYMSPAPGPIDPGDLEKRVLEACLTVYKVFPLLPSL